jgi:prepilin-type N-terminal cleavage/methylation domain-containing protein
MNLRRGFSLVELIVSLSIFALLSVSVLYVFGTKLNLSKKITGASQKQQLVNAVLTRISQDIRAASAIYPSSNAEKLLLSVEADSIEYSFINEKIRRKKNDYSAYLTDTGELKAPSFAYPFSRMVEVHLEGSKTKYLLRN